MGYLLLGKSLPYKKEGQSLIPLQKKKNEVLSVAICTHIPNAGAVETGGSLELTGQPA